MFKKFDHWLNIHGFLSKTGVVILGIGILLTFISFIKGIQILMFIPAFTLALFFYSFFDVLSAKKNLSLVWEKVRGENVLHIKWNNMPREYSFFRILFWDEKMYTILTPQKNNGFFIPSEKGIFFLSLQGRLDIFRRKIRIPEIPKNLSKKYEKKSDGDLYFWVRPYQNGDLLQRIDSVRTAKMDEIFIRERVQESRGNEAEGKENSFFFLWSTLPLLPRSDLQNGEKTEWVMIFFALLATLFQWGNFPFFVFGVLGILFIFWLKKRDFLPIGKRKELNLFGILFFFFSILESIFLIDFVEAGVYFLLFLAIGKHAFERERRDGLTYIFLILFVFVGLSLFTIRAWFILFFLFFLVQAIFLFSIYSGGEKPEEYKSSFGCTKTKKTFWTMVVNIIVFTLLLFFFLPHGDKSQDSSLAGIKEKGKTGFNNEVSLQDVKSIKQDFSKQIVIENVKKDEISLYQNLYWRGARFFSFSDEKWKNDTPLTRRMPIFNPKGIETKSLKIKYYPEGSSNIFLPAIPIRIFGGKEIVQSIFDPTIAKFQKPQLTSQVFDILFAIQDEKLTDFRLLYTPKDIVIDPKTEQIFENFWNTIPKNLQKNPKKLTEYIQNSFQYSLKNPAQNMMDFLYGSRQGHCEYFASVLTITLQHFGYHATLVNGFHSGEWNEQANAWILRGKNAHSWGEVWDGKKWHIFDPTPLEGGQEGFWFEKISFFSKTIQFYDFLDLKWYEYIVNFTGSKQRLFFSWLSENKIFVGFLLFSFFTLHIFKKYYFPKLKKNWNFSPEEKFLFWLSKEEKSHPFPLQKLEKYFPKLVFETRKLLYGRSQKFSLEVVKKWWKNR